jgi:hypothetical protein
VNPHAHSELNGWVLLQPRVQRLDRLHDPETASHRSLRVVFVGTREAEVDEQPVAEILRNVSVVPADDLGAGLLVGAHDLAQVLRVELRRERSGLHQVTKHHGELAAFGVGHTLWLEWADLVVGGEVLGEWVRQGRVTSGRTCCKT